MDEKELTSGEASGRLRQYGGNAIHTDSGTHPLRIFVVQFNNLMVYLLLFAAVLSFWFRDYLEVVIIPLVLMNALIGFWMEWQAQRSMGGLKRLASVPANVFRDGKLIEIPSEEVAPGDLMFVEAGDMITADAKIIQATQFSVNEASLTGEAMPVTKKRDENE